LYFDVKFLYKKNFLQKRRKIHAKTQRRKVLFFNELEFYILM